MKEIKHEVITQGTPRLENMPKEVFNVFCTSLLTLVEEFYKEEKAKDKRKDKAEGELSIEVQHI